jgi:hypothetical protein
MATKEEKKETFMVSLESHGSVVYITAVFKGATI